ncbi:MAG TPA: radical SAM protein [Candidatus Rhabdochlamydia sp.]|jgi:uncharacterized protein|nr:radical SAM protein [Candidatus Rhabdochlamydia sp.]
MEHLERLEVILKTVERCNLNCSYCYFFQGEDKSYKKHPPFISWGAIQRLVTFLAEGIQKLHIKSVQIDFHGGEPTLQRKTDFDRMCQYFREYLGPLTELTFALQTNATLINDEWIELFSKHRVSVGISIDGPKVVNDRFRIDHKGLGTYDRTVAGLQKLQAAVLAKKIDGIAALCVINPKNNASDLYTHIVHELKIRQLDFLLPDYTHLNFKNEDPNEYGRFLCELLHAWVADDDPLIRVRILNSALSLLTGGKTYLKGFGPTLDKIEAITVSSNGNLSPDDSLRSGIPHLMNKYNIFSTSLMEFFSMPEMKEVIQASQNSPDICKSCCWENVCGGNALISRYSLENGFNNPSVFCSGLKKFYSYVAKYLIENGISMDKIKETLFTSLPIVQNRCIIESK